MSRRFGLIYGPVALRACVLVLAGLLATAIASVVLLPAGLKRCRRSLALAKRAAVSPCLADRSPLAAGAPSSDCRMRRHAGYSKGPPLDAPQAGLIDFALSGRTRSIKNRPISACGAPEGPSEMNTASRLRPVPIVASARRPDDQQRLSDLIGVIYDAAIDPSLWEDAIEKAAYSVGGAGAALVDKDVGAGNAAFNITSGLRRLPVDLFKPISSSAEPHFLGDLEHPIATTDLHPFSDLVRPNCIVNGRSLWAMSISLARLSTGRPSASPYSACSATNGTGASMTGRAGKCG